MTMNSTLTGTALTLHDLGVAASFGGALYGQLAMHPALAKVEDKEQRGEILRDAWRSFSPTSLIAAGVVALTWITGRTAITGNIIDRQTRALVVAKDILVTAYVATGIATNVVGFLSSDNATSAGKSVGSYAQVDDAKAAALKGVSILGRVNLIAAAGIIAVTAVLNVKAGRSHKWAVVSKLLP
jgi:hypothetical protein